MPKSVFNKFKLPTLLKKTLTQVFSCEFFEIITGNFFIKHLQKASECWRLEKSSWLLVKDIFFQPSEVPNLDDSILIERFSLKNEGIHQISQKFLLCYQYVFHVWSLLEVCKSFTNICQMHGFFSMFLSCHFRPGCCNGWSNGVHGSFLVIFLFLSNISWGTLMIKNLFWLTYFLCSLSLLSIRS